MSEEVERTIYDYYGREGVIYTRADSAWEYRVEPDHSYKHAEDDEAEVVRVDTWRVSRRGKHSQSGWEVDSYYDRDDAEDVARLLASKRSSK